MSIHEGTQGTPKHFYAGVVFFILVVIITIVIFGYKQKVSNENNNYRTEISELTKTLSTLRSDKDLQTYELYDRNRKQLDILTYNSQVPQFYDEVSKLSRLYNFEFSNFSFNKGNVKIAALAKSDSSEAGYSKFGSLISDFYDARYSDDEEGKKSNLKSILDLEFVNSFQGSRNISTLLEFIIKPEEKEPVVKKVDTTKKTNTKDTSTKEPNNNVGDKDSVKLESALKEAANKQ